MTAPAFRVRVYQPESVGNAVLTPAAGAPHSSAFQVASIAGVAGYEPILDPGVTRSLKLDPVTKRYEVGELRLLLLDRRTGTVNADRWVTAFLGDTAGISQLAGARVEVDIARTGLAAGPWERFYTGRINEAGLNGRAAIEVVVTDRATDVEDLCFVGRAATSVTYVDGPQLWPLGSPFVGRRVALYEGVGLAANGEFGTTSDVSGRGYVINITEPGVSATLDERFALTVPRALLAKARSSVGANRYDFALNDEESPVWAEVDDGTTAVRLRVLSVGLKQTADKLTSIASITVRTALDIAAGTPIPLSFTAVRVRLLAGRDGALSEDTPIVTERIHPLVLVRDILQGKFGRLDATGAVTRTIPFNATAFSDAIGETGSTRWDLPLMRFVVTKSKKVFDFIEEDILAPLHIGYRFNVNGEFEPVDLRRAPGLASAASITANSVVVESPPTWRESTAAAFERLVIESPVDRVLTVKQAATLAKNSGGVYEGRPSLIEEERAPFQFVSLSNARGLDIARRTESLEAPGFRSGHPRDLDPAAWAQRYTNEVRQLYGWGETVGTLTLDPSDAVVQGTLPGDWRRINVDELPNRATNRRGGVRVFLVTGREDIPGAVVLEVLDGGPATVAGVPTISAPSVSGSLVQATVTLNASTPAEVKVAFVAVGAAIPNVDQPDAWRPLGTFATGGLKSLCEAPIRGRVYLAARTVPAAGDGGVFLPSAWVVTSGLDISGNVITGLANAAAVQPPYDRRLTWTNADARWPLLVSVRLTAGTEPLFSSTLPPGSTRCDLPAVLLPSTDYTATVEPLGALGVGLAASTQWVSGTAVVYPPSGTAPAISALLSPTTFPNPGDECGTILVLAAADGAQSIELERAPDAAGVPGTWAPLATLPPDTTTYFDELPADGVVRWYRAGQGGVYSGGIAATPGAVRSTPGGGLGVVGTPAASVVVGSTEYVRTILGYEPVSDATSSVAAPASLTGGFLPVATGAYTIGNSLIEQVGNRLTATVAGVAALIAQIATSASAGLPANRVMMGANSAHEVALLADPAAGGTAGRVGLWYYNGASWYVGARIANVAGGGATRGALALMPDGGTVVVGTDPGGSGILRVGGIARVTDLFAATASFTTPLPVASGGTGRNGFTTTGSGGRLALYDIGTGAFEVLTAGVSGRVLQSQGTIDSPTWAALPTFTSVAPGYAPASGGGTSNYLRADGTWAAPPASGAVAASAVTAGTFPDANYAFSDIVQAQTVVVRPATTTQDGIELSGRVGGSSSYRTVIRPGTLTASWTLTTAGNGDTTLVAGTMVPTTGAGASGTWGISVTGSAATLTTPRELWGQSFNGSANIGGNLHLAPSAGATVTGRLISVGYHDFVGLTANLYYAGTLDPRVATELRYINAAGVNNIAGGLLGIKGNATESGVELTWHTVPTSTGAGATPASATLRFRVTGAGTVFLGGAVSGVTSLAMGGALTGGTTGQFTTSVTTPLVTNAGTLSIAASGANPVQFSTAGSLRAQFLSTGDFQADVWTKIYSPNGGTGVLNLRDSAGTVDAREWSWRITGGNLEARSVADSNTTQTVVLSLARAGGVTIGTGGIAVTGNSTIAGTLSGVTTLTATSFVGSGASLTSLNANNVSSGVLALARGGTNNDTWTITGSGSRVTLYDNATTRLIPMTAGVAGQFLQSNGTAGDVLWASIPATPVFTSVASGVVPASGGGTVNFLRADGTWQAPTISSLSASSVLSGTFPDSLYTFSDAMAAVAITVRPTTATQDGLVLEGRAGGSSSLRVTIRPGTLTANRVLTLADGDTTLVAGTMVPTTRALTVAGTAGRITSSAGALDLSTNRTWTLDLATTSVGAASYGSATQVGTFTVDAYGRLTAASNVAIALNASAITAGTLTLARGGTNQTTYSTTGTGTRVLFYDIGTSGFNVLGAGVSGQFLQSQGTTGDVRWFTPPNFTSGAPGYAPASGGGTTTFLRADGTWVAPPSGGSISASSVLSGTFPDSLYTFSDAMAAVAITVRPTTATQDGLVLEGRAGGSSSLRVTIRPGTLTANRVLTLADGDTTLTTGAMVSQSGVYNDPAWLTGLGAAKIVGAVATATALASAQNVSITGDVTASAISFNGTAAVALASTIAANAVTFAKFQQLSANTFVANATGSLADAQAISTTRIPLFASAITGTPSGTTFLRGDGAWAVPAGGGSGTVTGPVSSTDRGIATWDGTLGTVLRNSGVVIDVNDKLILRTPTTTLASLNFPKIASAGNGAATAFSDGDMWREDGGLYYLDSYGSLNKTPIERMNAVTAASAPTFTSTTPADVTGLSMQIPAAPAGRSQYIVFEARIWLSSGTQTVGPRFALAFTTAPAAASWVCYGPRGASGIDAFFELHISSTTSGTSGTFDQVPVANTRYLYTMRGTIARSGGTAADTYRIQLGIETGSATVTCFPGSCVKYQVIENPS